MISVVVALSSSMPFTEVRFLGPIESYSDVCSIKLLTLLNVHEPLNDLSCDEADIVVLQLDKDLSAFEVLVVRTLSISHTFPSNKF